jgi:hypothetical protein
MITRNEVIAELLEEQAKVKKSFGVVYIMV